MKKITNLTVLMVIVAMITTSGNLLFAGEKCGGKCGKDAVFASVAEEKKDDAAKDAKSEKAEIKVEDKVLVTVNGEKVMQSQIDAMILDRMPQIASMPAENREQYLANIRPRAVDGFIVEKLLDEQIKKSDIKVTDEKINEKISEIASKNGMTMDQLKERLAQVNKDMEGLKKDVARGLKYELLFEKVAGDEIKIKDEDIKKYYDENLDQFKNNEQVKASHILVKVDDNASDEDKAAAKKKIEEILVKVKAGEDFAKLAEENSDCPSGKSSGGDLGFFEREKMVKPFSDAAFSMKVGDISDVVETRFGYHIIKVTDKKPEGQQSFDEVKAQIKENLEGSKRNDFTGKYIEDLKAKAKIEYSEELKQKPAPMVAPAAPKPAPKEAVKKEIKVKESK